jgi:hypothetical protein
VPESPMKLLTMWSRDLTEEPPCRPDKKDTPLRDVKDISVPKLPLREASSEIKGVLKLLLRLGFDVPTSTPPWLAASSCSAMSAKRWYLCKCYTIAGAEAWGVAHASTSAATS